MTDITLPCICCGKALTTAVSSDGDLNQPLEGCFFTSHGHYGCTVFDEIDGTWLEINVCDDCLIAAARKGHVLHGIPSRLPKPPPAYVTWQGTS